MVSAPIVNSNAVVAKAKRPAEILYELDEQGNLQEYQENEHRARAKHRNYAKQYLQAYFLQDQETMNEYEDRLSPQEIIRSEEDPEAHYFVCKRIVAYKFYLRDMDMNS